MSHTCVEMNFQSNGHVVSANYCLDIDLVVANFDCFLLEMHYMNRSVCQTFRSGPVRHDFGLVRDRTGSDHHHMVHYQTGHHDPCCLFDHDRLRVIVLDHNHTIVHHNGHHAHRVPVNPERVR